MCRAAMSVGQARELQARIHQASDRQARNAVLVALFALLFVVACDDGDDPPEQAAKSVPGTIEAEDFDPGGQGVAYHDATGGNAGGALRTAEDVDIFPAPGNSQGYVVDEFAGGEWLAYTVHVPETGAYDIAVHVANTSDDAGLHLEVDHAKATETLPVPAAAEDAGFTWFELPSLWLTAGRHRLALFSDGGSFAFDALRVLPAAASDAGTLLFRSGFEGDVQLLPPGDCFETGCWQALAGTDTASGFSWPPAAFVGESLLQLLVDAPVTPETVGNFIGNELQVVPGHDGQDTRALYTEIHQSGCCGTSPQGSGATQVPLQLLFASPPGDLYVSYWLKMQENLQDVMAAGTWRALFNIKTGTPGNDDGDYRIVSYVRNDQGSGALHWTCEGDNVAGGDYPRVNDWQVANTDVAVPAGDWFKFEAFVHRSTADDGRVWMAVNGQVICDRRGPNTGAASLPINRLMMPLLYSGSPYPIYQWVDDIQVWSGFPTQEDDPPYAPH